MAAVLIAFALLPGAAVAAPAAGQGYLPATPRNGCVGRRADSVFGVQVYNSVASGSPYFTSLQNLGASWVRVPADWSTVEPNDTDVANFKWNIVDANLQIAKQQCVHVIATIGSAPVWAQGIAGSSNGPIKPAMLPEFVEFVQALVERYDGDGVSDAPNGAVINYWEFYNEPDLGPSPNSATRWGNEGDQYAAMLKAVYAPIHAANPNAKVVMGGIAYDGFVENGGEGAFVRGFMKEVLDNGGGQYFDIMNFHFYPAFRSSRSHTRGTSLPEKTAEIRSLLAQAPYKLNKPLVITEAGWHNNDHAFLPSNDAIQSQYVVQFFLQSLALDIDFTIWWELRDSPSPNYQFANGLVVEATSNTPPAAKPAYAVYQTAVRWLAQADYIAKLGATETLDEAVEAYQFAAAVTHKPLYVAWFNPKWGKSDENHKYANWYDPAEYSQTRTLRLPGTSATIYSMNNVNLGVVTDGDGDGKIEVTVGSNPIYVVTH